MTLAGWTVIAVILLCVALLIGSRIPADVVFISGLTVLIVSKAVEPTEALVGFSNQGMLTVAALYVVAAGMKETGAIQYVVEKIIGRYEHSPDPDSYYGPGNGGECFSNNTPVAASFIPALEDWARKNKVKVSKLLIPLSYAAILGGTCTLIGTSTNLIVNGLLIQEASTNTIGIFEPALIGLPCAIGGLFIFGFLWGFATA
ncbi:MAG: SLC13 family permease [Fodinibius sp.]|nr:SLC13 family permease [Fodinibius sp.]